MKLHTFFLFLASVTAGASSLSGQTITIPTLTVDHISHSFGSNQASDLLASGDGVGGSVTLPSVTIEPGTYNAMTFTLQAPVGQQFKISAVNGASPTFLINYLIGGNTTGLTGATTKTLNFTNLSGNVPSFDVTGYSTPSGLAYYMDGGTNATPLDWYFTSFTYSLTFPNITYASETILNPTTTSKIRGMQFGAVDNAPSGGWVTLVPAVAIPEPSTWALGLGSGAGLLAMLRRRRTTA